MNKHDALIEQIRNTASAVTGLGNAIRDFEREGKQWLAEEPRPEHAKKFATFTQQASLTRANLAVLLQYAQSRLEVDLHQKKKAR